LVPVTPVPVWRRAGIEVEFKGNAPNLILVIPHESLIKSAASRNRKSF
jgi:hypothetical protein